MSSKTVANDAESVKKSRDGLTNVIDKRDSTLKLKQGKELTFSPRKLADCTSSFYASVNDDLSKVLANPWSMQQALKPQACGTCPLFRELVSFDLL